MYTTTWLPHSEPDILVQQQSKAYLVAVMHGCLSEGKIGCPTNQGLCQQASHIKDFVSPKQAKKKKKLSGILKCLQITDGVMSVLIFSPENIINRSRQNKTVVIFFLNGVGVGNTYKERNKKFNFVYDLKKNKTTHDSQSSEEPGTQMYFLRLQALTTNWLKQFKRKMRKNINRDFKICERYNH